MKSSELPEGSRPGCPPAFRPGTLEGGALQQPQTHSSIGHSYTSGLSPLFVNLRMSDSGIFVIPATVLGV